MKKAVVLSSGGLDSTTCLSLAVKEFGAENVSAVSFFYGQKHDKELRASEAIAEYFGIAHYQMDLSSIMQFSDCSLLSGSTKEINHKSYAEQIEEKGEGIIDTYVPFRNGLMLSAGAALAMSVYPDDEVTLWIGVHADDAAGNVYADCSLDFVNPMNDAITTGTYGKVKVYAPFAGKCSKSDVVRIGLENNAPYELTWSCYEGGEKPCGVCGTCIDRARAFADNGADDPALKGGK